MKKLLILLCLLTLPAFAQEQSMFSPDEDQASNALDDSPRSSIEVLVSHAVRMSGYSLPNAPLTVANVTPEQISEQLCGGHRNCPIFAYYLDDDLIRIHYDLLPQVYDHIVFHEIIHWLQQHSGKFDLNSCTDTIKREVEAFRLENRYISEVQHGFAFFPPPPDVGGAQCKN